MILLFIFIDNNVRLLSINLYIHYSMAISIIDYAIRNKNCYHNKVYISISL